VPRPPPPPKPALTLELLQQKIAALSAALPPVCTGTSFLQHTEESGWSCVTPFASSASGGLCRATSGGSSSVSCGVAAAFLTPPDCMPPGAQHLSFEEQVGAWGCICNAGWSGPSCNVSNGLATAGQCAPPAGNCTSGLYTYADGTFSCKA
jgi:hypothetical protein